MDVSQLWVQIEDYCKKLLDEQAFNRINKLTFDHYDAGTKTLTLCAESAIEALFIYRQYSTVMIDCLEAIVGSPANIVCKYRPAFAEPHERFKVQAGLR